MDFGQYLTTLTEEKRCFFLPSEIEQITLKNIGRFDEFNVEPKRFNLVSGIAGTGKTTLIRSIAYTFGIDEFNGDILIKEKKKEGEINLILKDQKTMSVKIPGSSKGHRNQSGNTCCILLDDCTDLNNNILQDFLQYLQGLNVQIILSKPIIDRTQDKIFLRLFPKSNIIELKRNNEGKINGIST